MRIFAKAWPLINSGASMLHRGMSAQGIAESGQAALVTAAPIA